eukprot:jgi/Psemu1/56973/gm1.56973_g
MLLRLGKGGNVPNGGGNHRNGCHGHHGQERERFHAAAVIVTVIAIAIAIVIAIAIAIAIAANDDDLWNCGVDTTNNNDGCNEYRKNPTDDLGTADVDVVDVDVVDFESIVTQSEQKRKQL